MRLAGLVLQKEGRPLVGRGHGVVAPPVCLLQLLGRGQTPSSRVSVPTRLVYGVTVKVTLNGVPIVAPVLVRGVAVRV